MFGLDLNASWMPFGAFSLFSAGCDTMDYYINELARNATMATTVIWRLWTSIKITIHKELPSSQHLINLFTENEDAVNLQVRQIQDQ